MLEIIHCTHLTENDLLEIANLFFDKDEYITEEGFYRLAYTASGEIDIHDDLQINITEILIRELQYLLYYIRGILIVPGSGRLINIQGLEIRFPAFQVVI